ncbi:MAG: hypothetical protein BWK79_04125 [Beggiatoa sp. IS2]|nr:MAG: hypothetical protein BWK79_04125 [Beggiatoa sp. IS2]
MSVPEQQRKQFLDYVLLQVFDDQYLDRKEEKRILEEGLKQGIGLEDGLALIRSAATKKGFVIERDIEDRAKELLSQFARNDGQIDKKEFQDAVGMFQNACKGRIPPPEIQKRLKKMILDNGWKAKEGGLFGSKWFSAI